MGDGRKSMDSGTLRADLLQVRSRICDGFLITMSLWALPALSASVYRSREIGWQPVMGLQLFLGLVIWAITFLRRRLPYSVRGGTVLVVFLLVGLGGVVQFGLVASGVAFLVGSGAVATMLFGRRGGTIVLIAAMVGGAAAGAATIAGFLSPSIRDLSTYVHAPAPWLTSLLSWAIVATGLNVSIYIFNGHLRRALVSSRANEEALKRHREDLEHTVAERTAELENAHRLLSKQTERLRELSLRDELTGLYNRRHVNEQAGRILDRARRDGRPCCVALVDIDRFKAINDKFGHGVGDSVLVAVARTLRDGIRAGDIAARYGGEEFLVVFTETSSEEACRICERLRETTESLPWVETAEGLEVTASFGVAGGNDWTEFETLVARADEKLYQAKKSGRNRVVG